MKIKYLIVGLLILTYLNSDAQTNFDSTKISNKTYLIVKEVAKYPGVKIKYLGSEGQEHIYNLPQQNLKESGSIPEFIELTKHPAIMVRYFALTMLVNVDTFNYIPHIIESLNKKETYFHAVGSFGFNLNYSDYIISLYQKQKVNNNISKKQLDSILIFDYTENCYSEKPFFVENNGKTDIISSKYCDQHDGKSVSYRDHLLINLPNNKSYYTRLKELYKKEKNPILIYSISKYYKDSDTSIIIKGLNDKYYSDLTFGKRQTFWCYKSIYENPKKIYFKYLLNNHKKLLTSGTNEEVVYFYLALLRYENRKTIKLLKNFIEKDNIDKYRNHRAFIWFALNETDSRYFKKIVNIVYLNEEEKNWMPHFTLNFERGGLYKKTKTNR